MFKDKKQSPSPRDAAILAGRGFDTQPARALTLLERLEAQRADKEAQFAVLNQELIELDAQIAGLTRAKALYPQIEQLVESLRGR